MLAVDPLEPLVRRLGDFQSAAQNPVYALASYMTAAELYQAMGERLSEARARNLSGDMCHCLGKKNDAASSYEIGLRIPSLFVHNRSYAD